MALDQEVGQAIASSLKARVDMAITARRYARDLIMGVSKKVKDSEYLSAEEKESLLKRLAEVE